MTDRRVCAGCAFADRSGGGMRCRRFPPALAEREPGAFVVLWPKVEAGDWCGEWRAAGAPPAAGRGEGVVPFRGSVS